MTKIQVIKAHRNLAVTPEEAWAVTSDTSRYAEWADDVIRVVEHSGPAAVGGAYREVVKGLGPMRIDATWTVRTLERPTLRVDTGAGFAPLHDVTNIFRFAPLGGGTGTAMTYEYHFRTRPALLAGPLRRILAPGLEAGFDRSMKALEAIILSERALSEE